MIVRFSKQEISECKQAASLRWQLARAANVANQRKDQSRTDQDIDYIGVKGELAVAKVLQINHDIHKGGIDPNIDMWYLEISIDVKTTFKPNGHLIFKSLDAFKSDIAILCSKVEDSEDILIEGWCTNKEFNNEARIVDLGAYECLGIPSVELRKIEQLWKFLTMKRVQ